MQVAELSAQLAVERSRVEALQADVAAGAAAITQLEADSARDVANLVQGARPSDGGAAMDEGPSGDGGGAGGDGVNADTMTVQEIKEWLTDRGHESEVWELATRKTPRVKKADWVALVRSKQG